MSNFMLSDEDSINDVNPFVTRDFSLPGGVRQTGDFADFTGIRFEKGIPEPERSVYCDYGLCKEASSACSLSRPLYPKRNIDPGFTKYKPTFVEKVKIGVVKDPVFSILGAILILTFITMSLYYVRR